MKFIKVQHRLSFLKNNLYQNSQKFWQNACVDNLIQDPVLDKTRSKKRILSLLHEDKILIVSSLIVSLLSWSLLSETMMHE